MELRVDAMLIAFTLVRRCMRERSDIGLTVEADASVCDIITLCTLAYQWAYVCVRVRACA
eukprot:716136-Pyramimonas_sp.AAC.1